MKSKDLVHDALYKQVRNEILRIIIERNLSPNELLPSEGEIAELCGVSKMTSKLALNLLMEEGIVNRIPRKGSFLNNIDINVVRSMLDGNNSANNLIVRTNFIVLIIPVLDSYIGDIVAGIEKAATRRNFNVVIKFSDNMKEKEEGIISEISKMPEIKGMILFPIDGDICGTELLNLKIKNYPIVIIDRVFKEVLFDSVFHNFFQGVKDIVNYFIEQGHNNIGYISEENLNVTSTEEKYQGYISGMMENNKLIKNENILFINATLNSKIIEDYLQRNKDITAIVCSNDYIVAKVYYTVIGLGKNIPEDLSITGFSDNSLLKFLPIDITTVRQPIEELCFEAIRVLHNRISDPSITSQVVKIETEIIMRSSVADITKDKQ
jgi:GntR family transcriptional regulator, arabinose operon transcriptional repressor